MTPPRTLRPDFVALLDRCRALGKSPTAAEWMLLTDSLIGIAQATEGMRQAQRDFFAARRRKDDAAADEAFQRSKAREKRVDRLLDELFQVAPHNEAQGSLDFIGRPTEGKR